MKNPTRREALTGVALGAIAAATPLARAQTGPALAGEKALSRIAFGSCAHQEKDQPIWEAVLAAKPELMIMLGDNVYLDTRDPAVMKAKYEKLAAKPLFQRARAEIPMIATWDDHDFGENDAGGDYPMKEETRRQFCDFWGEAADSPRRTRDGIYTSYVFGPQGRRVQVILPDLRWNRTPIQKLDLAGADYEAWAKAKEEAKLPVPGPYARNPDPTATMIGETQWRVPADVRVFGSSLQYIADFPGWEEWTNYPHDHQRLLQAIRSAKANGLFVISGDTHYGEISRLDVNVPYPIWDITSSGLTEVWPVLPPNAMRVGEAYRAENFGMIEIDWAAGAIDVQVRGMDGSVRLSQRISLNALQVG
jgi:alkaline phosphatase D